MALRVAPWFAPLPVGRSFRASPDRSFWRRAALVIVLALTLFTEALGDNLSSPLMTIAFCAALLGVGLPHGALDIGRIRQGASLSSPAALRSLGRYLGVAGVMALAWLIHPMSALALFLVLASVHFAEDWRDRLPKLLATGTAVALLASPAILHRTALYEIFATLAGTSAAMLLTDMLTLLAPIALMVASAGIALLWSIGERGRAIEIFVCLVALILLPPIAGFAIYFCLSHSLTQFARARGEAEGAAVLPLEIMALSAASVALAALIVAADTASTPSANVIAASFITLSVLTAAHMAAPWIAPQRSRAIASLA
jgi:beta-carotene 15,15'-dioxygenase